MPATRSRTSTEAPEVAVEDKKTEDIEQQKEEVKEAEVETEDKTTASESSADDNTTESTTEEKPVEKEEKNGSSTITTTTAGALTSDTNGEKIEEKVENGNGNDSTPNKRKSVGEEAGDGPQEITPKKAKVDAVDAEAEVTTGAKADNGAGEEEKSAVETTA